MYQRIKKRSGLTLIELLIAMLLFSAITGTAVLMLSTTLKIWNSNKDRSDIRQNGSLAMEKMIRYLGLADNITAATTDSITFSADIDNDGTDDTVAIAFDAVNRKVNITIGGATMTLTPNAQSFAFFYYQANSSVAFTPVTQDDFDSIYIIKISLTMSKGNDTVTLSSSAFCRNQGAV